MLGAWVKWQFCGYMSAVVPSLEVPFCEKWYRCLRFKDEAIAFGVFVFKLHTLIVVIFRSKGGQVA